MWSIAFKALFGWIGDLLSGWLMRKHLAEQTQRADTAEAKTAQDEQIIKVQESRSETDQAVDSAGVDAARKQLRDDGFNQP